MFKINFHGFCPIAAGLATLGLYLNVIFDLPHRINQGWVISFFLLPTTLIFGALTLLQLTKASLPNLFFRILSFLALIIAIFITIELSLSLIISYMESKWAMKLMIFLGQLFQNEDRTFAITYISFYIILIGLGIGFLIHQKWLIAMSLFSISLPVLIYRLSSSLNTQHWSTLFLTGLSSIPWFIIAWLLKKENSKITINS